MTTYARWLFGTAAAFNLAVGLAFLLLRPVLLERFGLDPIAGTNSMIANLTGMFIALFGYAYLMAAIDPVRYRPYIWLGAVGKLLALACAFVPWLTGAMHTRPPLLLAGDLVYALLFFDYLRRTRTI